MDLSDRDRERLRKAPALDVGGAPADSQASLCVYAETLDPGSVTDLIGCSPTSARRKGELDPSRPKIPPARVGQWFLEAPSELPFEDKIRHLLESTSGDPGAWDELARSHEFHVRCAIFLESWTEGIWLDAETLGEMSRRGWALALSMYSAEGEEILDAFLADAERDG